MTADMPDATQVAPVDIYRAIRARVNEAGDLPREAITSVCRDIANALGAQAMQAAMAGREVVHSLVESLVYGADMISEYLEKYHDYEGDTPAKSALRDIMHHLQGASLEPAGAQGGGAASPVATMAATLQAVAEEGVLVPERLATPAPDVPGLVERLRETSPRYDRLTGKHMYDVYENRDGEEASDTIAALQAEVERLREAQSGFLIGDRITIRGKYEQDWLGWSGYLCGAVMEANGKINVTISENYPPKHFGEMTDGFSFSDLSTALAPAKAGGVRWRRNSHQPTPRR